MELKKALTYKASIEEMKNFQLLFGNVLKQGYHKVLNIVYYFLSNKINQANFLSIFLLEFNFLWV